MRIKSLLVLFFNLLFVASLLIGCGGGSGSPGSHGTEDTGVKIDATIIPVYLAANTYSVDVQQDICDVGPPPVFETFTDHGATVTFAATLINPNSTFQLGKLYVEKYTVEYRRSTDSIGSPPIQTDTRFRTIVITPPTGAGTTEVTDTLIFVDLLRKDQYRTDVLSGQFSSGLSLINNYTAIYTFEGKNEFGTGFSFKAQTDFQIGNFDYCE